MPHRKRMRAALAILIFAGLLATVSHRASAAELGVGFEMIPDDAQMALIIPELDRFKLKMAHLNQSLKLDIPGMTDVLDEFQRTAGMHKGVNDKGAIIVAVLDFQKMDGVPEPAALMLIPVSDYADFVGNFDGNARAAVTQLKMPWGQTVHCKQSSDYAVMGASSETVERYLPGSGIRKVGGNDTLLADELADADMAVIVDARSAAPTLRAIAQHYIDLFPEWFKKSTPAAGSFTDRLSDSLVNTANDLTETIINNTEILALTTNIDEQGVRLALSANLKAGTPPTKLFKAGTDTGVGLAQLPNDRFLIASSLDVTAFDVKQLAGDIKANLEKNKVPLLGERINTLAPLMGRATRSSRVTYAPKELNFTTQFGKVILIDTGDGRAFKAGFRAHIDGLDNQRIKLGRIPSAPRSPEMASEIRVRSQYSSGAQLIDGIEVDQYLVEYEIPPQVLGALGPTAGWVMMFVGREQKGFVAAMDKGVLITTTDDTQLLRTIINSIKSDEGLGASAGIEATKTKLPSLPAYQWYTSASDIARIYNQAAKILSQDALPELEIGPDLDPLAIGVKGNDKTVVMRAYMTMPAIKETRLPFMMVWNALFYPSESTEEIKPMEDENVARRNNNMMNFDGPGPPR